jgi:hypothetical protein
MLMPVLYQFSLLPTLATVTSGDIFCSSYMKWQACTS